ncbi:BolA family transcriptional regulator [Prochlorococcus sp. MIT 1223]|uniref:BolA family protein n=1 Tax=Prochlorococcus sp. MIT 1223 TaxID=3096217 RepID=UPI002A75E7FB|nr:BolA family transcriptional regulator [Prochlorococcus sp. MIT 1223]
MIKQEEVISAIIRVIPDAKVTVEDLNGGGDHFQVNVVSSAFEGVSLIKQHQMIYGALSNEMANESIHALALNTSTPN